NLGLRPLDSRHKRVYARLRRALRGNERDHASASNNTSSFPRRVSAPGVLHPCFTHPESRGGRSAERRSGARRTARGHAITRRARRLRGALRPMTQQYTGRNNVTISMPDGGSVPIVSQTEIEPMKTALSLMLALITTTALTEPLPVPKPPGPGGSCSHGYIPSGSYCTPVAGCSGRHRRRTVAG